MVLLPLFSFDVFAALHEINLLAKQLHKHSDGIRL